MKKIIYTFCLGLACFSLTAQCDAPTGGTGSSPGGTVGGGSLSLGGSSTHVVSQQFFNDVFAGDFSPQMSYANVKGSAFLADNAIKSTLIMNDGSVIKDVPLQIDLYKQDFIATNVEGNEIFLNKQYFTEIIIPFEGQDILLKKINPEKPNQFFEVLYEDGDMVFFKERYVTKKEAVNNGMAKRDAQFTEREKYFMQHGDEAVAKVKLKKKDMFGNFAEAEVHAMLEYAKAKGIKLKSELDYVAVFEGVSK